MRPHAIHALMLACASVLPAAAQVPAALSAPGDRVLFTLGATGVQVYECRAGADGALAWAFREPRAPLTRAGAPFGRHYAGPSWEAADGSLVVGRVVARANGALPTAIPLLRLEVSERRGQGVLAEVTHILRLNTAGGVLSGPCSMAGQVSEVVYTADYVMLRNP